MRNCPKAERPREERLEHGVATLADTELLAEFIETGRRGQTAVDNGRNLLARYGSLKALLEREVSALVAKSRLGTAKSCRLHSALELGRRCLVCDLRQPQELANPAACADNLCARIGAHPQEVFACLFLDNRHRILAFERIPRGTLDGASVHPREIGRRRTEPSRSRDHHRTQACAGNDPGARTRLLHRRRCADLLRDARLALIPFRLYSGREDGCAVIFLYPTEFAADDVERRVPDAATARTLVRERNPQLLELLVYRRERFAPLIAARTDNPPIVGAEDAVLMAFCRLAFRHGTWGNDFHAYHNEGHIFEILGARLERLIDAIGIGALNLRDWFLLALFAATHDLRQRETPQFAAGVGSNERASIEETFRILHACGFNVERNAEVFIGIEMMIAGSTFDARPPLPALELNSAEVVVESGGALAQKLDAKLDKHVPSWHKDPRIVHALDLALIAADLDTANVSEAFALFMASTERLCLEREMRSHRDPAGAASAQPMLNFLTTGQEHYFFDLHRFSSAQGRTAFAAAKQANVRPMLGLIRDLRAAVPTPGTGNEVLAAFHALAGKVG